MLPGFEIQKKMSPPYRGHVSIEDAKANRAKESAVLILLYEIENECYLVLTERKKYHGVHSGQISLPGGKREGNESFEQNAIRETEEEIGVPKHQIEVLSCLSHLYIPVSNFMVYPFVACLDEKVLFEKEEKEVENILEVKISDLLNDKNLIEKQISLGSNGFQFNAPAYAVNGVEVWGATAMILSEFLAIVKN